MILRQKKFGLTPTFSPDVYVCLHYALCAFWSYLVYRCPSVAEQKTPHIIFRRAFWSHKTVIFSALKRLWDVAANAAIATDFVPLSETAPKH